MYVYVLECKNGRLYIGQTADLEKRIEKHQSNPSRQMKGMLPVRLLGYKKAADRSEAVKIERYLKALKKRKAVLKYISNT